MKKNIIILSALLFIQCGSLKKQKQSIELKTQIDSTSKNITETNLEGVKETKINYKANTFTFTPFDPQTPFFVDGKEYRNVVVQSKEETKDEFTLEQYREKILEQSEIILKLKKDLEVEKMHKEKDNTNLLLGIAGIIAFFLFVVILVIIWYFNAQLKKFL
jgi:hypothetical protein